MGDWDVRDRVGSGYPDDASRAAMEAGFVLTGGTFDERLKSTRISGRWAQPLPWRGETSVEVSDLTANNDTFS